MNTTVAGSGSTALAADRMQFDSISIEFDPAYVAIAEQRVHGDAPLFAQAGRLMSDGTELAAGGRL